MTMYTLTATKTETNESGKTVSATYNVKPIELEVLFNEDKQFRNLETDPENAFFDAFERLRIYPSTAECNCFADLFTTCELVATNGETTKMSYKDLLNNTEYKLDDVLTLDFSFGSKENKLCVQLELSEPDSYNMFLTFVNYFMHNYFGAKMLPYMLKSLLETCLFECEHLKKTEKTDTALYKQLEHVANNLLQDVFLELLTTELEVYRMAREFSPEKALAHYKRKVDTVFRIS